jgi:hypothetical protein
MWEKTSFHYYHLFIFSGLESFGPDPRQGCFLKCRIQISESNRICDMDDLNFWEICIFMCDGINNIALSKECIFSRMRYWEHY